MALIESYYAKPGRRRRPFWLGKMLIGSTSFSTGSTSDPAAEDTIYDREEIRRFVGVELGKDRVLDESKILRFRYLLDKKKALTKAVFEVRVRFWRRSGSF